MGVGKKKILFVCTGNSCRSVMAEGLLKQILQRKGRADVQVISAGISTAGGVSPTLETIEVMKQEGIDVSEHLSQPLGPELVTHADAIFCMEEFHRDVILSQMPEVESKVYLMKTFLAKSPPVDPNVPDPISRPREVYESCFLAVKEAVERIAHWLEKDSQESGAGDGKQEKRG